MTRPRWGIAGYGDVVVRRALPALRAIGQPAVALWGRQGARARAIAERHGIPVGTERLDELIEAVDAVYIATPVASHLPLALAAVAAGRHVLVEKPLAAALDIDGSALAAAARAHGVCAGVAYYRRLAPAMRRLRAVAAEGAFAEAMVVFRQPFDPAPADPRYWRTDRAVAGGGVLADAGSHRIDLLCWVLGIPDRVIGNLSDRYPGGGERTGRLTLFWADRARATVRARWTPGASGAPVDRLSLTGDRGSVTVDPLDTGRLVWRVGGRVSTEVLPPAANQHCALFVDFAAAIRDGRAPACPVAEAQLVDAVLRAVERSSDAGGTPLPVRRAEP